MKYFKSHTRKHNNQNKQYVAIKWITNNLLPHGKNFTCKCFIIFWINGAQSINFVSLDEGQNHVTSYIWTEIGMRAHRLR